MIIDKLKYYFNELLLECRYIVIKQTSNHVITILMKSFSIALKM